MKYVTGIHADLENKTIVVVYFCYFGDMVSITPFLEVLRRAAKGSKIYLVMDQRFQEALAYNPNIDKLIAVDRKHMGLGKTWNLGKEIGKLSPDYMIMLHGTTRTTLMAMAAKPKVWAGEPGTRMDPMLMTWPLDMERKDCHVTEKYLYALEDIGVSDTKHEGMRIYTCEDWEKAAADFYHAAGVRKGDKLVGLSVGSSTPEKNWPAENYAEVADHFAALGYRPVFFGVPGELPLVEKALSAMKHKDEAIVAAGKLSMGEFIAAASRCSLAFTNDSGPMYVFDSRKVPVIALFGPSNGKLYHPLGKKSCALASTDMPRTQDHVNHTIRDKSYVPIEEIPVKEVIRAGEWAIGLLEDETYEGHLVFLRDGTMRR